jgi:hypothetical protein
MIGGTGRRHMVAQRQQVLAGRGAARGRGGVMSADLERSDDDRGDGGGDYGYDLAHEVTAGLGDPPRRSIGLPVAMSTAPFQVDPHGDLGYDSAHEG